MTKYQSKHVDTNGQITWSKEDDQMWHDLITRQMTLVKPRACRAYLEGLDMLNLPMDHVPQLPDINRVLFQQTGWKIEPVSALINFDKFFALLANKQFPVATFLRSKEEFDYLQEPDFFHEIFGHCAMLTHPDFAKFTHTYGLIGRDANAQQRAYLARLYWFTVEFGLVRESGETKIYGGGILSSPGETLYSLDDPRATKQDFDVGTILRTPYRIDIMQPTYFILDDINSLYSISKLNLIDQVETAMKAGLLPPLFEPKETTHA